MARTSLLMMARSEHYLPDPPRQTSRRSHGFSAKFVKELTAEVMANMRAEDRSAAAIRPAATPTPVVVQRRAVIDQDAEDEAMAGELYGLTPQGKAQLTQSLEARKSQPIPKPKPRPGQAEDDADEQLASELFDLASDGRPSRPLPKMAMAGDLGLDNQTDDQLADELFAYTKQGGAPAGKSEVGNLEVEDDDSMFGLSDQGQAMGAEDESDDAILADELFRLACPE